MGLSRRQLVVGLVVLAVLLGVYLVYTRLDGSEGVELAVSDRFKGAVPAGNTFPSDSNTGRVGDLRIGTVRETVFRHQTDGVVDREFGFVELLHQQGDRWEVTQPYMRLFLPEFRGHVTADRGEVRCEASLGGQLIPNDAKFSGNVIIHVVSTEAEDPLEFFVYLDDVAFIAERSAFSTSGPIKVVSRIAQLAGRGMELIYDQGRNRLNLFRIYQLESLRFRSADLESLAAESGGQTFPGAGPDRSAAPADTQDVVVVAGGPQAGSAPDYYECVFWKNVRIETPERIIAARRHLAIHNILWSKGNAMEPNAPVPGAVSTVATVRPEPNEPNEPEYVPYPGPNALNTKPSNFIALSTLPESSFDIVVTCDGGFIVGPKGIGTGAPEPNEPIMVASAADASTLASPDPNHQTLFAEQIDVNAATSDAVLAGPVRIGFTLDANDVTAGAGAIPVMVIARNVVRYLAAANRIGLEGDCVVTMRQTVEMPDGPPAYDEYVLKAQILLLDLVEDANTGQFKVRHVTAMGGAVSLQGIRQVGGEPVGWVKLEGTRLDFDAIANDFVVTGPGAISLHNAKTIEAGPDASAVEISLRRPCYALLSDFQRLTYSGSTRRIVAESSEPIQLGYVPILADGRYGPRINAAGGHIEVQLTETADGRAELASITASRGVAYVDDTQRFAGSTLTYDHAAGLIRVTGDASQPCYLNGVLVDQIEMDVATGNTKAEFRAPGTLLIR
ncbi:MAG: hypothetical protein JW993_03030 [Sedimentisphaerales bacterium]|nr:hypothetical protein [Sedimentisphaerales bacterium]